MARVHEYVDGRGFYIRSAFGNAIVTYQVASAGVRWLREHGYDDGASLDAGTIDFLVRAELIYTGGGGAGDNPYDPPSPGKRYSLRQGHDRPPEDTPPPPPPPPPEPRSPAGFFARLNLDTPNARWFVRSNFGGPLWTYEFTAAGDRWLVEHRLSDGGLIDYDAFRRLIDLRWIVAEDAVDAEQTRTDETVEVNRGPEPAPKPKSSDGDAALGCGCVGALLLVWPLGWAATVGWAWFTADVLPAFAPHDAGAWRGLAFVAGTVAAFVIVAIAAARSK